MESSKKWEVRGTSQVKSNAVDVDDIVKLLLENRGITSKKEREGFLNPKLEDVTIDAVGIDKKNFTKALKRVSNAIEKNEQIIVFGDYDVDGITGSAILWETVHEYTNNVLPYIPHRIDEGYGLSVRGIENLLKEKPRTKLIITVDNGIVANEAVAFANAKGIDVIITDHHLPHTDEKHVLPDAHAIVHTTELCGAAVAYLFSKEIRNQHSKRVVKEQDDIHLELAALGTIADMVPLTRANRIIAYHGIKKLCETKRYGLLALFEEASIDPFLGIRSYQVGHHIAPRLNAAGRLESAMDSLRLLCTNSENRAQSLARQLGKVNRQRQDLMSSATLHAIDRIRSSESSGKKILVIAHESYAEGVIGLIAGRLVEEFYKPAIVISKRETHSKASVRSVRGFNIIEFLRSHSDYFVNVGGHPMAAGFTVETTQIRNLTEALETSAEEAVTEDMLYRSINIDLEITLSQISDELFQSIQNLEPFGVGNPEPVFLTRNVTVDDARIIGKEGKHLKLKVSQNSKKCDVIAFGMGERGKDVNKGDKIDIVYAVDENVWNGKTSLQLKLKDFKNVY